MESGSDISYSFILRHVPVNGKLWSARPRDPLSGAVEE